MREYEIRPGGSRRARRAMALLGDACAAAVYTAVLLGQALGAAGAAPEPGPHLWVSLGVVAATGPPVAARRWRPAAVFWVTLAMSLTGASLGIFAEPLIGPALALYTVAATGTAARGVPLWAVGGPTVVAVIALGALGPREFQMAGVAYTVVVGVVVLGFAWTLGRGRRDRRLAAERFGQQLAEHAVTRERMRIAREMHDVVAHSMGLITVKAGVANHVARSRPDEARDALRVIEDTGREALAELRHMLDVLRSPEGAEAGTGAPPAPGVAGLPALAERAAQAGVHVDLDVDVRRRLPHGVDLAVFRIVQEALTNIVKHAAPARAAVSVTAAAGQVRIDVSDDGPGRPATVRRPGQGPGHGLIGMAERVAVYRGRFDAGPGGDGGFRVTAVLPCDPPLRAEVPA
nr:sensor histidine kinase [Nocardiopsis sp. CMB-M0232]